jgi:hypothetical protein
MSYIDIDEANELIMVPEDMQIMITRRALGAIIFQLDNRLDMIHDLKDIIAERDAEISNLRGRIEDARDTSRVDYSI